MPSGVALGLLMIPLIGGVFGIAARLAGLRYGRLGVACLWVFAAFAWSAYLTTRGMSNLEARGLPPERRHPVMWFALGTIMLSSILLPPALGAMRSLNLATLPSLARTAVNSAGLTALGAVCTFIVIALLDVAGALSFIRR